MSSVTVTQLRAHLREYVAQVEAGDEFVITRRGRSVARLVPVSSGDRAAPVLRVGRGRLPDSFLAGPLPRARASVLEALLEERADGR